MSLKWREGGYEENQLLNGTRFPCRQRRWICSNVRSATVEEGCSTGNSRVINGEYKSFIQLFEPEILEFRQSPGAVLALKEKKKKPNETQTPETTPTQANKQATVQRGFSKPERCPTLPNSARVVCHPQSCHQIWLKPTLPPKQINATAETS